MNSVATEQSVGQLRLSLHEQSPLPHLSGKVSQIQVKGEYIFCEAKVHEQIESVVQYSMAKDQQFFVAFYSIEEIKSILIANAKTRNRIFTIALGSVEYSNTINRKEVCDIFTLTRDEANLYFSDKSKHGSDNVAIKDLNQEEIFDLPPKQSSFSSKVFDDNFLIITVNDENNIYNVTDQVWGQASEIKAPYFKNGLLKFPLSVNLLQFSAISAFVDGNTIVSVDQEGVVSRTDCSNPHMPILSEIGKLELPEGMIITGFSGARNFPVYFVTARNGEQSTLLAFSRDSLELLAEVRGVNGPISCDDAGNIYFVDLNQTVRVVSSNLSALSGKTITARSSQQLALIQSAAAVLDGLTLPDGAELEHSVDATTSREVSALNDVQISLLGKIQPEIDKCTSLSQINSLLTRIEKIRTKAEFVALPAAFELVDKNIASKKEELAYPELEVKIDQIERDIEAQNPNLPAVRSDFLSLQGIRASVVLTDSQKRAEIGERIGKIKTFIKNSAHKADEQASKKVNLDLEELKKEISTCATEEEILAIVMEGTGREIKEIISQIDDKELKSQLQQSFNDTVAEKISELATTLQNQKLKDLEVRLQIREELKTLQEAFANALAKVSDRNTLNQQANSPVARALRNQIEKLPEEERSQAHTQLTRQIAERGKVIDFTARVNDLSAVKGVVKFKEIEFPRSGDFELLFEPHFIPMRGRSGFAELVWRDSRGKEYRPEVEPVTISASDMDKAQLIKTTKEEASKFFMAMTPKPPVIRNNWTINDHFETHLAKLARLLLFQKQLQQGFAIIEGDAGAAKSGLVQMFCALTNNCLETFACNGQTEKEDLTYLYQYDPEKGTYRLDSGFVEALQTPNTVILLEEINTLPVPVAKMLNTLLDFRRELFLPDGRKIKADPSVLIIGLQNPQTYAGVNKLSKEFLDRALVMHMDYATEIEGSRMLPYEAEMYAKYRPILADFSQEVFYILWDHVINNSDSEVAKSLLTPQIVREIKGLKTIVSVANSARAAYRAYQTEESTDPFDFIFSYRSGEIIASLWDGVSLVEDTIAEIVLPKIADAIEKKAMAALIKST